MKIFYMSLLLCLNTFWVSAQLWVGGRVGVGLAKFTGSTYAGLNRDVILVPAIGGTAGYKFTDNFSVFGELSYNMFGGREEGDYVTSTTTANNKVYTNSVNLRARYQLHYVNIPILARVSFGDPDDIRFFVNAGPYLGILVAAREQLYFDRKLTEKGEDVKSSFNSTDVGLVTGIGLEIPTDGTGNVLIELRYNRGFTNIAANSSSTVHNSAFTLSGAYILPAKK